MSERKRGEWGERKKERKRERERERGKELKVMYVTNCKLYFNM